MMHPPRKRSRCPRVARQWMSVVAFVALSCIAGDAWGQFPIVRTWTNANGGCWCDLFSWNPSGVPDEDDGAQFLLDATYTITFPNDATAAIVTVGNGSVTFDMNTSGTARTLTVPGTLTVTGGSELEVQTGTVAAGNIVVKDFGFLNGGLSATITAPDGMVTVSGAGSIWRIRNGFLRVGESGDGTLLIEDGGSIFNNDGAAIGRFAGSSGMATVTGNNSTLDIDATLTVGQEGMGTLLIEDGGNVENVLGRVAFDAGATGSVTVTGEGSTWTNEGELRVGESGEGTLLIEDGGNVSNAGSTIGFNSGSIGIATVTGVGSTWANDAMLDVGSSGTGELVISDGGSVTNTMGRIARESGSTGTVTVTGAGSHWTNSGELRVGNMGMGELTIADGGTVSTTSNGRIGRQVGSSGEATVTGLGSTWTMGNELIVGEAGMGTLLISSGGSISSTRGSLAKEANSNGTVTVTGTGSTWTNSGELRVGEEGAAMLLIEAGGSVSNTDGFIAGQDGSTATATVTVTGADSTWTNVGNLRLGHDGTGEIDEGIGTLNIQNGGTVVVGSGGSGVISSNVHSQINLDSDGVLDVHGSVFMGGGALNFLGGTLLMEQIDLADNGGTLINQGGVLAPRNSSDFDPQVGPLAAIFDDYAQQAAGTLQIEIGPTVPGLVDKLLVIGNVLLNGTIEVVLFDGFTPTLGDMFTIIETEALDMTFGNISGQFGTIDAPIVDGLTFDVIYNPTSVVLEVVEAAGLPGDYNQNGVVDAADYTVWRDNLGAPAGTLPNDTDGGPIGQAQYQTWKGNFGATSDAGLAGSAVPEPSALLLAIAALASSLLGSCCTRSEPDQSDK